MICVVSARRHIPAWS